MFLPDTTATLTAADGYRAADIIIEELMHEECKHLPKTAKRIDRRSSAYRLGYYHGLVAANAMHGLGRYPKSNVAAIQAAILRDTDRKLTCPEANEGA